jgi:hypothetical protein
MAKRCGCLVGSIHQLSVTQAKGFLLEPGSRNLVVSSLLVPRVLRSNPASFKIKKTKIDLINFTNTRLAHNANV